MDGLYTAALSDESPSCCHGHGKHLIKKKLLKRATAILVLFLELRSLFQGPNRDPERCAVPVMMIPSYLLRGSINPMTQESPPAFLNIPGFVDSKADVPGIRGLQSSASLGDISRSIPYPALLILSKQLIEMTLNTAQLKLSKGNPGEALPAAIHCLRFATELYGISTIESVPSYLLLAEVNLGLGRLTQAEEYLTQSQWVIMKNPECSHVLHQKLCRSYGLLCSVKGDLEEAIRYLANEVYFASEEFGCNSTAAAGGFYRMANVFSQQGKTDIADSFYTEGVVEVLQQRAQQFLQRPLAAPMEPGRAVPNSCGRPRHLCNPGGCHLVLWGGNAMNEAQRAEASQILNSILDVQEKATKQEPDKICRTLHTLAMLHYLNTDLSKEFVSFRIPLGVRAQGQPLYSTPRAIAGPKRNYRAVTAVEDDSDKEEQCHKSARD
ncbi:ZMY12 protein, partial [Polypterus senegalus]